MSTKKTKSKRTQAMQCTRCGENDHTRGEQCPAINITCHKCKRKGYFASQCFSKTAKATTEEVSLDLSLFDAITSESQTSWNTKNMVCKRVVNKCL